MLVDSRISVVLSDGPSMKNNQIYCGLSPFVGVLIYSDNDIKELSTDNNIVWKKFRFICVDIYGKFCAYSVIFCIF